MRGLVVGFGALLLVPVGLLALWAADRLPPFLPLWLAVACIPVTGALFLAAAVVAIDQEGS